MKKTQSIMGKDFDGDKIAKLLKNRKKLGQFGLIVLSKDKFIFYK